MLWDGKVVAVKQLVSIALGLLELFEQHPEEEAGSMVGIRSANPAFHVKPLLRMLRARRRELREDEKHS